MKPLYIDSSDEEQKEEKRLTSKITTINYSNYLLQNILNIENIYNNEEFKVKLGLILHNLADRIFRSSVIDNIYQNIKAAHLSLNEDNYSKILNAIKTTFNKKLNQLFVDDNKENIIIDKDYIQLFNFLFDKNIKLPQAFKLKKDIEPNQAKKSLIAELQITGIDLEPTFQNPLNIEMSTSNSPEILTYSKLANRNNKNKLKYLTIEEANNYSTPTIYKLHNLKLKTFSDSHVFHYKTGNVQTEKFGFGTYKDIFQEILNNELHKEAIVKRIFQVIQNKENNNVPELPKGLNNFVEQLSHLLFIIEMQRNNTTLFTAPMFLELIAKDNKYLKEEKFFPMSAKTAVSQARGITCNNAKSLPNSHFMDYDTVNIKDGSELLQNEGNLFTEWFKKIIGNDKLYYIHQLINALTSLKIIETKATEDINLVSIKDLAQFIKLSRLSNLSENLITKLEQSFNILIIEFGSRPSQYFPLFKEALLKKTIFSDKVKSLIKNTFTEFQKILPKLDSFLAKVQENLEKDIKKIIPEVLQILCNKLKEWYNIDAPEYITATNEKPDEKKVLGDITSKINNYVFSESNGKLKLSIPPIKRKIDDKEDIYNSSKFLKTPDEIDNAIEEYLKLMGEEFGSKSL